MSSCRWVFTLNNYTEEDVEKLAFERCVYYIVGRERAPSTGTPHLQGFVIFAARRSLRKVREIYPRACWMKARGTSMEASRYCKKEGDYVEYGTCPQDPGSTEKTRWEAALAAAQTGNLAEIPADILIRYLGNILKIRTLYQPIPPTLTMMDFHWYWGPTGTGKSVKARTENPDYYLKGINKWWDGFTNQKCVIIEEWGPMDTGAERIMGHYLKQWMDYHPFQAETKGGYKMIRPLKIIITSNYSPQECFHDPQTIDPLMRRMNVIHFNAFFRPSPALDLHYSPSPINNSISLFPDFDG